jgi:import inner membrane translocase subunit TIM10
MSFFGLGGQQAQPQGSINPAAVSSTAFVFLTRALRSHLSAYILFFPLSTFHMIASIMISTPSLQIEMAVSELDMITDVFNRLVNSCHAKCISEKYLEGDLNKGEGVCIDRCTAKFFEVSSRARGLLLHDRSWGVLVSLRFRFLSRLVCSHTPTTTRSKVVCTRNPSNGPAQTFSPSHPPRWRSGGESHPRTFCAIYRVGSSRHPQGDDEELFILEQGD